MTGITSVIDKYSDCEEDIQRFISYVPNLMEKATKELALPISDEEAHWLPIIKMLGIPKEVFDQWLQMQKKKVAS